MAYVIPAPATPAVPVAGSDDLFPVRRVFCVGRNYAAHAREMGHDPDREAPFFFMKPADALVPGGGDVPYPPATSDLHHEIELVVALGSGGKDIPVEAANDAIWGYGVGVDLTRRDVRARRRSSGARGTWARASTIPGRSPPFIEEPDRADRRRGHHP